MAVKKGGSRRSPSPYNRNSLAEKDEGISEDGEELTPAELKVQLEVSEQETGLLRKKVENLLTDNLKLTKEVREITTKLTEQKKQTTSSPFSYGGQKPKGNDQNEKKIEELQSEVNASRVKIIEKDRELERLDAQLKQGKPPSKTLRRSGSQDEDLLKKLNVIEKEAEVLRNKTQELETENENLKSETKKLQSGGFAKKPPASTQEKLQMDKFALEEKVKGMEGKLKESNKKIVELEESIKASAKTNLELDRLKRDKTSLESEVGKLRELSTAEKRKADKLERDNAAATEKTEKAQREIIAAEREKRRSDEEKAQLESKNNRLESDLRVQMR